jgi:O-antigen/teichoic acid export membrane protein
MEAFAIRARESARRANAGSAAYIRGSSLLVVGRLIAQAAEIGTLVVLARYLSKADYGALSYALSLVVLLKAVALFELPNTLGRFLPLYREDRRDDSVLGGVAVGVTIVSLLGLGLAVAVDLAVLVLHVHPTGDATALRMVAIIAFVAPIEALDVLLTSLFAVFAGARAIFVRQALLGPGLKLALVASALTFQLDVRGVGFAYLAVGAVGVVAYGWMLRVPLRRQFDRTRTSRVRLSFPVGEIVRFAAPLLASTLVWSLMESSDSLLLGYFRDTSDVAAFRAVMPLAVLNKGVILTFGLLYTPMLARLFARDRHGEVSDAYWRAAAWVTVLTLPVFIVTFSFARATTVGLLGDKYASSVPIMAILSCGYFFHTALGYNGLTLRVYGKIRYSVAVDLFAAALNIGVNLALIPAFGAIGAAIGTTSTLVVHNLLKQWGLRHYTGVALFDRRYVRPYALVVGTAASLVIVQAALPQTLWLAVGLAAVAGAVVVRWGGSALDVAGTFPELARLPLLRVLLVPSRA